MSLPVRFHRLAGVDVDETSQWYEERQRGLGDQFLVAVESTIDRARRWPGSGAPIIRDPGGEVVERRLATHGFPYVIRYRMRDDQLVVMAVHHSTAIARNRNLAHRDDT